jgi:hypothetical protein
MTDLRITAWQKEHGIEPATGEHLRNLEALSRFAYALIQIVELEKSGIRDGHGAWSGSDAYCGFCDQGKKILDDAIVAASVSRRESDFDACRDPNGRPHERYRDLRVVPDDESGLEECHLCHKLFDGGCITPWVDGQEVFICWPCTHFVGDFPVDVTAGAPHPDASECLPF